jgi:hypothetical protein
MYIQYAKFRFSGGGTDELGGTVISKSISMVSMLDSEKQGILMLIKRLVRGGSNLEKAVVVQINTMFEEYRSNKTRKD